MDNRRFARKIRRMARIKTRAGEMSRGDLERIIVASHKKDIVSKWRNKLELPMYGAPWMRQGLIDWTAIWEWLKNNWPAILQILLSLLVFLGEKSDEDNTNSNTFIPTNEINLVHQRG